MLDDVDVLAGMLDITEESQGILFIDCNAAEAGAATLLAASVFHFHMIDIPELKDYLRDRGLNVK